MHKLIRFYHQNRKRIWGLIIAIVLGFALIQVINQNTKIQLDQKKESTSNRKTQNNYANQSKSMITGGTVTEKYQEKFGSLLDNFLTYCINHEPEKAYGLLSQECKQLLYPNETIFDEQYCQGKFSGDKKYSFQSWTSSDTYIYQVKIFDNMLSTGIANTKTYIQDYISVIKENDTYKLNVNGYIGRVYRNKTKKQDNLEFTIKNVDLFMDYEIDTIIIVNQSQKDILLDPRKDMGSMYLVNDKDITFDAYSYENLEEQFKVKAGETKEVKIKFGNSYQEKNEIKQINFTKVILDFDQYQQDPDQYQKYKTITIDL